MENKINIAEILKDAPIGTEFWSKDYGGVKYEGAMIDPSRVSPCLTFRCVRDSRLVNYTDDYGQTSPYGECIIFPAKDQTWENFKAPWKHQHFEPYQKVLIVERDYDTIEKWRPDIYKYYDELSGGHITMAYKYLIMDDEILPYEGYEELSGKEVKS